MLKHTIRLVAPIILLAAAPALADQPSAKPLPFKLTPVRKATPKPKPVPPGPAYEAAMGKVAAAIKPGMDANQVSETFSKLGHGLPGAPASYVNVPVETYTLPDKSRVEVQLGFYRTTSMATKHIALMAFKSPENDFTGGHSKLLKVSLLNNPKEPSVVTSAKPIKSLHDINKLSQYKFSPAL